MNYELHCFVSDKTNSVYVVLVRNGLDFQYASFADWRHFTAHHEWLILSGITIRVYPPHRRTP